MSKLKENLLYICKDRELDFKDLSKKTGINLQTIYKFCERGVNPTLDIVVKLCNCLDCSIDYLLGLTNNDVKDGIYKPENFIKNYEMLLKERNLSNYKICKDTNIGRNRIYDWKKGKFPYVSTLITLSEYFNVSIDFLLAGD